MSISVTSSLRFYLVPFEHIPLSLVLLVSQLCVYALYKRASSPLPEGPSLSPGCLSKAL